MKEEMKVKGTTMKPLVLYHANCWDGFCAAWVAKKALGDIEAVPVQYGQMWPEHKPAFEGREVYVVDFSFTWMQTVAMAKESAALVVLDHHKTAEAELSGVPDECRNRGIKQPTIVFDMNKSGGRLAWEYFFPTKRPSWLVDYTEDRDLWRHALPTSREINASLRSLPLDFAAWDCLHEACNLTVMAAEGAAIIRREKQIIDDHIRHAREIEMNGHKILAVNATVLFSDIAGELAKGRPFGACYFDRGDGKRQWSLRSETNGVDVSEVAKSNGGGGHKHASGFEQDAA